MASASLRSFLLRSTAVKPPRAVPTLTSLRGIASTSTSRPVVALLPRVSTPLYSTRRWNANVPGPGSSASASAGSEATSGDGSVNENPAIEAPVEGAKPQKIGQIEPRLQMTFTCTANDCGHRSTHEFSKRAYTKGIVLVQCPECKARHLIADHIGWFKESLEDGKLKTVEDLLAAKGEKIRKGRVNMDGDIEYEGED